MKLAVRKEPGIVPGSGFHYMLFPMKMDENGMESEFFRLMGYVIVDVEDARGEELLAQGRAALKHQVEIAYLTDAAEKEIK